ncbi:hypothetical protein FHR70_000440 [Microvirga lupini]|uniref:YCII-related domain-containing protein n=1 Tax=Microvirga lupini TaxID=420324 RepID=A0A7W4VIJ6_9HYPH|nr:YciI family protein [Microvirga lupini]MBB3017400.1 hypothetical protein [Microvirga lupini]
MYWLMICRHKSGMEEQREQHRDAHRQHVATGGGGIAKVLIGSALTEDDAESPLGNFGILEAPTREAAQAFAENDPFARAGLVEAIEITALSSRFQAQRIDPMTA